MDLPGVCGGRDDKVKLGDIIVAINVFTFQKGKENDDDFEDE